MARKLFEFRATRARAGGLAVGIEYVVWDNEAATVLADISTSSGGSSIAGSTVTTADIAGLGPSACRFWGPTDDQDTLWVTCPSDPTLGVQRVEASTDARLDALEAGGGGAHPNLAAHNTLGLATQAELDAQTDRIDIIVDEGPLWMDDPRVGAVLDGATDDGAAYDVAKALVKTAGAGGTSGGAIGIPARRMLLTNRQLIVPNYTTLKGVNGIASQIKAGGSFPTSTPLIRLGEGTGIVFNCRVEDLLLDCANIAGSTGVYSTEAQEGSGLLRVAVTEFRLYGTNFDSGVQNATIHDSMVYPSLSGSTVCARFNSAAGNSITDTTLGTGNGGTHADGILVMQGSLMVTRCHVEGTTDGIQFDNLADGIVMGFLGFPSVTNLVHLAGTTGVNCYDLVKQGGTNILVDDWANLTLTDDILRVYAQSITYSGQETVLKIPAAGGFATMKWLSNDAGASLINQFAVSNDGSTFFDWSRVAGNTGDLIFRSTSGATERLRLFNDGGMQLGGTSIGAKILADGGSPEGVHTAPIGSLYLRLVNGGTGTTLYVKESGAGNTGWVAK